MHMQKSADGIVGRDEAMSRKEPDRRPEHWPTRVGHPTSMQIDDATRQATAPGPETDDRMSPTTVSGAEVGTAADGRTKAEGPEAGMMSDGVDGGNPVPYSILTIRPDDTA
jgi:hypothetical protein